MVKHDAHKVWLSLGSNLGDRQKNLTLARKRIENNSALHIVGSSTLFESEPIGVADKPFINSALSILSELNPLSLLHFLKTIEKEMGRDHNQEPWSNRPIDIDIIWFESVFLNLPNLKLPHIHYKKRLFVLLPLRDLEPNWIDPISGKPLSNLIEKADPIDIKKISTHW